VRRNYTTKNDICGMYEAVAFPVSVCEIVARSRPLRHTLLSEHRPQLGIILPCSNTSPHTHTNMNIKPGNPEQRVTSCPIRAQGDSLLSPEAF